MKYIISFLLCLSVLLLASPTPVRASTELLTSSWHMDGNNNAQEKYQSISSAALNGKSSLTLTYDLHGLCLLGGDASAIIFDQSGWKYVSLSSYGTNCQNGSQTVTIPLANFTGLNTSSTVGQFHSRVWHSGTWTVDITSAVLNDVAPNHRWNLQSVDAMKVTKDVICTGAQKDITYINNWLDKAVESGATHVAISQPYDNPACGNSLTYTQTWVTAIRAHGLKVWHRHMPLAFEGIYSTTKSNSDYYFDMISSYITSNPTLFATGDVFTPIPEPQNGGINGVTGCGSVCQFQSQKDFNNWLKTAMLVSELSFKQLGYNPGDVKIGYFGFDGYVVWGECNSDWSGILTDATVTRMGNITIDHYECGGRSMLTALTDTTKSFRKKYPTTPLIIGEWGTIQATNSATQVTALTSAYDAFISANVVGVNYWHLGTGSSNEALVNADWSVRAAFNTLKSYFLP